MPNPSSACVLCDGLLAGRSSGQWDSVLAETPDYVVVPTKGALLAGWLLVVSKQHALCSGALKTDLQQVARAGAVDLAKSMIESRFGPTTAFEHGPHIGATSLGCGVDHLHIHVAPLSFSLQSAVERLYPGTDWHQLNDWNDLSPIHANKSPYMAVQEPNGALKWSLPPAGVRQPLRRAIAASVGLFDEFDYSAHPQTENVASTITLLVGA